MIDSISLSSPFHNLNFALTNVRVDRYVVGNGYCTVPVKVQANGTVVLFCCCAVVLLSAAALRCGP